MISFQQFKLGCILRTLYPDVPIYENERPEWMRPACNIHVRLDHIHPVEHCNYCEENQPLELDFYIDAEKLAFEFQGGQHDRSILGGKGKPRRAERIDALKHRLCAAEGFRLIEVRPKDLTVHTVAELIANPEHL